jgi:hypothetical protein
MVIFFSEIGDHQENRHRSQHKKICVFEGGPRAIELKCADESFCGAERNSKFVKSLHAVPPKKTYVGNGYKFHSPVLVPNQPIFFSSAFFFLCTLLYCTVLPDGSPSGGPPRDALPITCSR